MDRAEIIRNTPHCPECKIKLREYSIDVFLVECEQEKYFEFVRRCEKCHGVFSYYIDTEFETRADLLNKEVRRITGDW